MAVNLHVLSVYHNAIVKQETYEKLHRNLKTEIGASQCLMEEVLDTVPSFRSVVSADDIVAPREPQLGGRFMLKIHEYIGGCFVNQRSHRNAEEDEMGSASTLVPHSDTIKDAAPNIAATDAELEVADCTTLSSSFEDQTRIGYSNPKYSGSNDSISSLISEDSAYSIGDEGLQLENYIAGRLRDQRKKGVATSLFVNMEAKIPIGL